MLQQFVYQRVAVNTPRSTHGDGFGAICRAEVASSMLEGTAWPVEDLIPGMYKGNFGTSSTSVAIESCLGNVRPQIVRILAVSHAAPGILLLRAEGL